MDKRTLKQRIHDSEVKWDAYMRVFAWGNSLHVDKQSVLWFCAEKMNGHAALLEHYKQRYKWYHRLLGVKKPVVPPMKNYERNK